MELEEGAGEEAEAIKSSRQTDHRILVDRVTETLNREATVETSSLHRYESESESESECETC